MHAVKDYKGLRPFTKHEEAYFKKQYEMDPDTFKEKYYDKYEYTTDDLTGKFVLAVETCISSPEYIEEGKYCIKILDIYSPRADQKATLDYCGHIAFVDVKGKDNKRVVLLYKDDECFPQPFSDWYETLLESYEDNSCGIIPSKQDIIELMKLIIRAECQIPELLIEINEEDIIVLQGL